MAKKEYGTCHICGKESELSFEHIPPKVAFNCNRTKMYAGDVIREHIMNPDSLPWEYSEEKYISHQQGSGYYSLCKSCNNYTGRWYVPEYGKFAATCLNMLSEVNPSVNSMIGFKCKEFRPLPVFKEIMAMFCSVNSDLYEDKQLSNFILNKDSTDFNSEKYQVYIYLFVGVMERRAGFSCSLNLLSNQITVVSEICAFPLGLILCTEGSCSRFATDITSFSKCNYNASCLLDIEMHVHECNTIFPLDYRTKEEILSERADK